MPTSTYDVGAGIRLSATFKDLSGTLADPTSVVLELHDPAGVVTTPSVTRTGTGQYYADLVAGSVLGTWLYAWEASGTVTAVEGGQFYVTSQFAVPPAPNAIDLTTLASLKDFIQSMQVAQTADDRVLQRLITSASQYFLTRTSRASLNSIDAYSRRYDGNNQDSLLLSEWPVTAVTLVQIGPVTIRQTPDFIQPGWAINSDQTGIVLVGGGCRFPYLSVFPRGRMNVRVDHSGGYSGVPADLEEACNTLVTQNFKRRGWVDQSSMALPDGGGTTSYRSWEAPPLVERAIKNYRRYHL